MQLELMDERDYDNYLSLFRHMSNFMCRPNLIVYLDVSSCPAHAHPFRQTTKCFAKRFGPPRPTLVNANTRR